jgi:hypothetical protein
MFRHKALLITDTLQIELSAALTYRFRLGVGSESKRPAPACSFNRSIPTHRHCPELAQECRQIGRRMVSDPEGDLRPMQHVCAVEKLHRSGLYLCGSIMRKHDRRDDHIAAVVEDDG